MPWCLDNLPLTFGWNTVSHQRQAALQALARLQPTVLLLVTNALISSFSDTCKSSTDSSAASQLCPSDPDNGAGTCPAIAAGDSCAVNGTTLYLASSIAQPCLDLCFPCLRGFLEVCLHLTVCVLQICALRAPRALHPAPSPKEIPRLEPVQT